MRSRRALDWAWKCPINRSSDKLLLLRLADSADGNNICAPSRDDLASDTAMDIKTVRAGLRRLQDDGYIIATAERYGGTKQVIGWRLTLPKTEGLNPTKNGHLSERLTLPKTDTFPETGTVAIFRPKPPISDEKGDQKRSPSLGVLVPEVQKNKERKKVRERNSPSESKESPPPKRRRQVPPDWQPNDAGRQYAKVRGLQPSEIEGFRNYHISKGNVFLDIDRAWMVWCAHAVEFGRGQARQPGVTTERTAANPTGRPIREIVPY